MRWTQFENPLLTQSIGVIVALLVLLALAVALNLNVFVAALIAVGVCTLVCYTLWPRSESVDSQ